MNTFLDELIMIALENRNLEASARLDVPVEYDGIGKIVGA